jgi:cyanophycinase
MHTGGGLLALVGAGEFLEPMREVDAYLLGQAPGKRAVVLPTASAPDGPGVAERWAAMGAAHFRSLGAEAEPVMALNRADGFDSRHVEAVRRAHLVYFSGGKPGFLLSALAGTPLWDAVMDVRARGGVVAGCSAGAMILGGWLPGRPSLRQPPFWQPAFGLVRRSVVLPHFNEFPTWVHSAMFGLRPRGSFLIGVDAHTALVGSGDIWTVMGRGSVTVRTAHSRRRYAGGEAIHDFPES